MRASFRFGLMRLGLCYLFLLTLATLAIPGCALFDKTAPSANPFAACKSVGQCYLATAGTYSASQQAALELLQNPDTPGVVKENLQRADREAEPVYEQLSQAYRVYRHAKADLAAGAGSADKVAIATADLQKWLTEAGPLVLKLSALAGS
jgi:hypothetical protein